MTRSKRRARLASSLIILGLAAGLVPLGGTAAATEGGATRRPDVRVGFESTGPFTGNDEYATTAIPSQQMSGMVSAGGFAIFHLSVQNDGTANDTFKIKVIEDSFSHFTIRYVRAGVDISAQVRAGTYTVDNLAPGASAVIKIKIKAKPSAPPNSFRGVLVKVKAGVIKDVARFEAQRHPF